MKWEGAKVRELAKTYKFSQQKLSDEIGVSRQTVIDWINGQIPKGHHLISLCKILKVKPDEFFTKSVENNYTIPVHRAKGTAIVSKEMRKASNDLVHEYEPLFTNFKESTIIPSIKVSDKGNENAKKIAEELREKAGVNKDKPFDYTDTFTLIKNLGIIIVFRHFSDPIKSYAFFSKVSGHRVIFVNNNTNIIDLIFPLLHETIHAIRDDYTNIDGYDSDEDFCDLVANYIQFPDNYTELVYSAIKGLNPEIQVNKLKEFAGHYNHSLHGIDKSIKKLHPEFDLNVHGANTNLKKEFPSIGDILFESDDPRAFVDTLSVLSNKFINVLRDQTETLSVRKLGELLGLDNVLDAKLVKDELTKTGVLKAK